MQAGDVLAGRYRLDDLLAESGDGRFWRAHDLVLHRPVSVHLLAADDDRAAALLEAARRTGPVINRRLLRVLDAEVTDERCYVVNEWGQGDSLDILLTREGPLPPRRAAWLVGEVADSIAEAHAAGLAHGSLTPENVLVDQHGQVRLIGFGVEAALRGLPPGRISVDEIDLVALLYCALTGRWAGVSRSAVAPAPEVHGTVLRPRRVRAGIPRLLDTVCDQVLNPEHAHGTGADHSAAGLRDLLQEFVGEVTATPAPAGVRPVALPPDPATDRTPTEPTEVTEVVDGAATAVTPAVSEPVTEPVTEPVASPDPEPTGAADAPTPVTDLPTEAGMPVFHDDDEVDWLRARADTPAPPPPLTDPTPKPLFAPDPPEGEPVRRPRPGSRAASAASGGDYWPWEASQGAGAPPVGRDTGAWSSAASSSGSWGPGQWGDDRWGTGEGLGDTGDQVPGRSWFRLAVIVGICLVVLVAVVAAYQLGLKPPTDSGSDEPTTSASPSLAAPTPFPDLAADDFDPQGTDGQQENPDSVPNVLDGDPATSWSTSTYEQNFGPGGLKTGVGLVVDLGATRAVRQVVVTVEGQTALAAYVTSEAPTAIAGLTPVGSVSGSGELTLDLDEPVSGRYVTVWLTIIPPVDGGFRGTVSEVQVLG